MIEKEFKVTVGSFPTKNNLQRPTFFFSRGSLEPSRFTTKIDSSSGALFFRVTPNKVDASSGGGFNSVEPPTIDFDNSDEGEDDDAVEYTAKTNVAN